MMNSPLEQELIKRAQPPSFPPSPASAWGSNPYAQPAKAQTPNPTPTLASRQI